MMTQIGMIQKTKRTRRRSEPNEMLKSRSQSNQLLKSKNLDWAKHPKLLDSFKHHQAQHSLKLLKRILHNSRQ
jgi:hypothetical protein